MWRDAQIGECSILLYNKKSDLKVGIMDELVEAARQGNTEQVTHLLLNKDHERDTMNDATPNHSLKKRSKKI